MKCLTQSGVDYKTWMVDAISTCTKNSIANSNAFRLSQFRSTRTSSLRMKTDNGESMDRHSIKWKWIIHACWLRIDHWHTQKEREKTTKRSTLGIQSGFALKAQSLFIHGRMRSDCKLKEEQKNNRKTITKLKSIFVLVQLTCISIN